MTEAEMMRFVRMVLLMAISASLATLASCGSKEEETPKEVKKPEPPPDPGEMCEVIWQERQDLGGIIWKDEDGTKKPVYTGYCLTLPVEYLVCESKDPMTDECITLKKKHQGDLNDVIVSGKLPGQAEREKAEREAAELAVVAKRQASRGKDSCSQICGHERDIGFQPDEGDSVEKEKDCVKRCGDLVVKGGLAKELVEGIEKDCLALTNMFDFAKCKSDANNAAKGKSKDDPPRF